MMTSAKQLCTAIVLLLLGTKGGGRRIACGVVCLWNDCIFKDAFLNSL